MVPLFSVIIPAYNEAECVGRALESALRQQYPHVEVVLVNDASTDDTERVVLENYPQVTYIKHEHNQGLPATRNTGVEASRGEIVTFLDADDEIHPLKLPIQASVLMADTGFHVVDTGELRYDSTGRVCGLHLGSPMGAVLDYSPVDEAWYARWYGGASLALWRAAFLDIGGYDTERAVMDDKNIYLSLQARGYRVAHIALPLYMRHLRPGSLITQVSDMTEKGLQVLEKWRPGHERASGLWGDAEFERALRCVLLRRTYRHLVVGDYSTAVDMANRARSLNAGSFGGQVFATLASSMPRLVGFGVRRFDTLLRWGNGWRARCKVKEAQRAVAEFAASVDSRFLGAADDAAV